MHPEWIVADVLDYRPEPRAFDLVIVLYLQLPAGQRRAVVRAAARALASGGTLLIVAHDSENIERGYGGPQDPAVLCSTHDLIADLDVTDVRLERAEQRPVKTPHGQPIALDALLRATRPDKPTRGYTDRYQEFTLYN